MKIEGEYGATKIKIEGEPDRFSLLVWDRQIQPPAMPIGRVICERKDIRSVDDAKKMAAQSIAGDQHLDAEHVGRDILWNGPV